MENIDHEKLSTAINYLQEQIDHVDRLPFCSKDTAERYQNDKYVLSVLKQLV